MKYRPNSQITSTHAGDSSAIDIIITKVKQLAVRRGRVADSRVVNVYSNRCKISCRARAQKLAIVTTGLLQTVAS